MKTSGRARARGAAGLLAALALSLGAAALNAQKQGHRKKKRAAAPAPATVPFAVGEKLEYAAQWNKYVIAATLELGVIEQREFFGGPAWHFQAQAHSIDPVRRLFTIDDQFDSYTDAVTLDSRQYELHLREQSKREDTVVAMSQKPDTSRGNKHVYLVLPGTQDPLGVFYWLRAHDWTKEPATHVPVFDGRRFYDLEAQREATGSSLTVAGGSFVVTRIALRIFTGGQEMTGLKLWLSLAQDAARTPVLIEAEAPLGTVHAELTAKGP